MEKTTALAVDESLRFSPKAKAKSTTGLPVGIYFSEILVTSFAGVLFWVLAC
jgi:hypothetical protein